MRKTTLPPLTLTDIRHLSLTDHHLFDLKKGKCPGTYDARKDIWYIKVKGRKYPRKWIVALLKYRRWVEAVDYINPLWPIADRDSDENVVAPECLTGNDRIVYCGEMRKVFMANRESEMVEVQRQKKLEWHANLDEEGRAARSKRNRENAKRAWPKRTKENRTWIYNRMLEKEQEWV